MSYDSRRKPTTCGQFKRQKRNVPDRERIASLCATLHPPRLTFGDDELAGARWYLWATEKQKTHTQHLCPHCGKYAIWKPRTTEEITEYARKIPTQIRVMVEKLSTLELNRGRKATDEDLAQVLKEVNFDLKDYLPKHMRKRDED